MGSATPNGSYDESETLMRDNPEYEQGWSDGYTAATVDLNEKWQSRISQIVQDLEAASTFNSDLTPQTHYTTGQVDAYETAANFVRTIGELNEEKTKSSIFESALNASKKISPGQSSDSGRFSTGAGERSSDFGTRLPGTKRRPRCWIDTSKPFQTGYRTT